MKSAEKKALLYLILKDIIQTLHYVGYALAVVQKTKIMEE
jgi:hypothetical protein